ncbi:MAG: ion transporter [Saprospiraceae bacterium]|nr:MAG: ion transporter [Saprospiraceae bacterium]
MATKKKSQFKPDPKKEWLHEIIFEADTRIGRIFDIVLLIIIAASVIVVALESMENLHIRFSKLFLILEWTFTIIFTLEYALRLYCVYEPWKYAKSFFGIIDLLATLPTYLSLVFTGSHYFLVIRVLRLMRIFRIFKLGHFMKEGFIIVEALKASRIKITVFLIFVILMTIIIGSLMYLLEGGQNPSFSSIPRSVYWAIVTLTTVGYGDITPVTPLGQLLSAVVMIMGYAILAVPTGIVSAEFIQKNKKVYSTNTQACRFCGREGHDNNAQYCKFCGNILNEPEVD